MEHITNYFKRKMKLCLCLFVHSTNFIKTNGVGSLNLKIINNITFLQTGSVL
jgi:hypothetical protein